MKLLMILLGVAYPLIAHAAVVSHSSALTIASLAVLAALTLLPRLVSRSAVAWCAVPIIALALVALWEVHAAWLPLYATPVFVNFFGAWLFGHTLAAGETPLVERLARLLHEPDDLEPAIVRYARKVTLGWTLLLSALALINLTLAMLVTPDGLLLLAGIHPPVTVSKETWSLFANFLNYLFAGAFFLLEYMYRQHLFPQQPYRNVFDFIRRAAAVGHRALGPRRP